MPWGRSQPNPNHEEPNSKNQIGMLFGIWFLEFGSFLLTLPTLAVRDYRQNHYGDQNKSNSSGEVNHGCPLFASTRPLFPL